MKLIFLLAISMFILSVSSVAQSNFYNPKYIFNPMYSNPANTGMGGKIDLNLSMKSRFNFSSVGFPNQEILSVGASFDNKKWKFGLSAMHEDFVRARLVLVKPALAYYMFMNEGRSILSIGIASSINHFRIGIRESLLTSLPIQNKNFQNLETGVFYKNRFGYLGFAATGLIHRNVNAMDVQGNEFPFLSQEKSLALSGGISTNELSNVFLIRPSFSIARVGLSIRPTAVIARTEFNLEIEFYQQVNIGISHRNDLLDEIFSSSAQQIDFWLGYKNDKIKMMLLGNWNTSMEQFAAELMFGYRFWENEVIPLKNYHFF